VKRIIAAILCLLLVVSLFGCGQKAAPADEGSADAAPAAPSNELEQVIADGVMKVGIEGVFKPFTYHAEDDSLTGLDVELARAIGEKLGVEVEFVEAKWDSLLAGVDAGRLDTVINYVSMSDARKEKYDFAGPYLYIPKQVVCRTDNDWLVDTDALKGAVCATSANSTTVQLYEQFGCEFEYIAGSDEAAQLVKSGRADFCNFDPVVLMSYLEEHPDADLKVGFVLEGYSESVGIPIRKDEPEFRDAVVAALEELQAEGYVEELCQKFLGGDYTKQP